ncbi:MAG: hypothetical protein WCF60_08365 [Anaerobacillus sp.]
MNKNSIVKTIPLHSFQNNKTFIVENIESEEYFEMSEVCIKAIDLLNMDLPLNEIQNHLEITYDQEEVDIYEFVDQLVLLNLISEVDGQSIQNDRKRRKTQKSVINSIPANIGKVFFNKLSLILYLLIMLVNVTLFFEFPDLIPTYKDFFVFKSMIFNVLSMMVISIFFAMIHEFGHILAARSFDIPTNLGISNRLFLIVSEADMTHAWKLSKTKRNILYLGGLCFDNVILIVFLVAQIYWSGSSFGQSIMALIVFDVSIKILYQFCFYMKTDLYYVLENSSGCHNLMENSNHYLMKKFPFMKKTQSIVMFEGEEKFIRWYSIFYFSGVLITLSLFFGWMIPQITISLNITLPHLLLPASNPMFWDAVFFFAQIFLWIGLLTLSLYRKYVVN